MNQKKQFHLTIVLIIILIIASFTTIINTSAELSENNIQLSFSYSYPQPTIQNIEINDETFHRITINGLPNSGYTQNLYLPSHPVKILLPYGTEIDKINIYAPQTEIIGITLNIEKKPTLRPLSDTNGPISQSTNLQTKKFSNTIPYSYTGTYTLHGYRIAYITLHPLTYKTDTNELRFYPTMQLQITTKPNPTKSIIRQNQQDQLQIIQTVENPETITTYKNVYQPINKQTTEYIIITNQNFSNTGENYSFQDLLLNKQTKGLNTSLVTVENIENNPQFWINGTWGDNTPTNPFYTSAITKNFTLFNDTQAKIRNFIRYAYYELGTQYVLLGGDADTNNPPENIIPLRGLYAVETGLPLQNEPTLLDTEEDDIPSDIYYACLDGNFNYDQDQHFGENATQNNITEIDEADLLAEINIGRACVDSTTEINNFIYKTLAYESSDHPYLSKLLWVGEDLGFPGISEWGGNYKDEIIPYIPEEYNLETLYDRNWSDYSWPKTYMLYHLNSAPPHIINHLGHGFVNYALKLTNSDIETLTNNHFFFIYSQTCLAGSFDNRYKNNYYTDDCAAEHFTVETPHGAFAVIMNARYGLGSENTLYAPSQIIDESFFKALYTENIRQLGPANHYAKQDHIWHIDENGIRWVYYQTNLLGDPEISIKNPITENIDFNITFQKPDELGSLYILNNKILTLPFRQTPIILGKITVQIEAQTTPENNIFSCEFLIDDRSQHVDIDTPYEFDLNTFMIGKYSMTVNLHGYYGQQKQKTLKFWSFILGS